MNSILPHPSASTLSQDDLVGLDQLFEKHRESLKNHEEDGTFPLDFFEHLHKSGWLTGFLPQESSTALDTSDLCLVMERIARYSPGLSTSFAGNLLAWVPLLKGLDSKELLTRIHRYRESFFLSSFCFTEPNTGSDVFNAKTIARETQDGYEISGQKCFVTNGNFAKQFVVVARVFEGDPSLKKLALFLVDGDSPGVSRGKPYSKMGHRDSNTTDLFFEGVKIPKSYRLSTTSGPEIDLALHSIQRSRTLLAAASVGLSHRAIQLAERYLSERVLYGKPLIQQPNIRSQLVQMKTEMKAAWLMTIAAAQAWDQGVRDFAPSSMAKLYAGQVCTKISSTALELFGGWGCTKEYPIERFYRDAKFYEILEGPTHVQHAILGRELLPHFASQKKSKSA